MIGVSNSAPTLPMLVIVNVPPDSSSGPILASRVRRRDVGDPLGQPGDVEVLGVLDHRDEEAARGVHGDRQVDVAVVDDLLLLDVDRRVERGVLLERLDRRLREERQEVSLTPSRRSKSAFTRARSRAMRVTSTSCTVVSWADTCSDSVIRWAMT
jgi:hypothetical protein